MSKPMPSAVAFVAKSLREQLIELRELADETQRLYSRIMVVIDEVSKAWGFLGVEDHQDAPSVVRYSGEDARELVGTLRVLGFSVKLGELDLERVEQVEAIELYGGRGVRFIGTDAEESVLFNFVLSPAPP